MRGQNGRFVSSLTETERQERLIKSHIWLAHNMTYRACRRYFQSNYDDIYCWALDGLWKAAQTYDSTTGVEFKNWARTKIAGAIIDGYRSFNRSRRRHSVDLEGPLSREPSLLNDSGAVSLSQVVTEDGECELADLIVDHRAEFVEAYSLQEAIEMAINESLSAKEQYVVHLYYYLGYRLREIGGFLGVSESRVSQLNTNAIEKLRSYFGVESGSKPMPEGKYDLLSELLLTYLRDHGGVIHAGKMTIAFKLAHLLDINHLTAGRLLSRLIKNEHVYPVREGRRIDSIILAHL